MGEVLLLRMPERKLGPDDVILVPRESNTDTARAVLARPQEYSDSILRAACIWLRDYGDWMDHERASRLLKVLDAQASEEALWLRERIEEVCIVLGIVIAVAVISVFDAAWGQHLAAGVLR